MDHLHRFPIIAAAPDGSWTRKPLHMTVGPGLAPDGTIDPDAPQVTILWAWSAALSRGYPWVITPDAPVQVPGRADRWSLNTDEHGLLSLRYSRSASCCGEPLRRWRPPGVGASRRSASA